MDRLGRVNEFGHYSFLPFLRSGVRKSKPFFCDVLFFQGGIFVGGPLLWTVCYNYKVKIEAVVCNSIPYCRLFFSFAVFGMDGCIFSVY